jgi:hypothetical protein
MLEIYMPRIYVNEYNPREITSKWDILEPYYVKKTTKDMIYSDEGIYAINNNHLFRVYPIDKETQVSERFSVDHSYFIEKEVESQIPFDHIRDRKELLHFCVGQKSNLHLIVEGYYDYTSLGANMTTQDLSDKYYKFIPCDLYFFTQENIKNELLVKEVNVLLSII